MAKSGYRALVVRFAQGANARPFEVTPCVLDLAEREGVTAALERCKAVTNFLEFLGLNTPSHQGMITFVDGRCLMADITDVVQGQIYAGATARMVFGIKGFDPKRSFVRHIWKARPA